MLFCIIYFSNGKLMDFVKNIYFADLLIKLRLSAGKMTDKVKQFVN